MTEKAYGSGYFGEWTEDEFGLPAYRYTCDQLNDPKAVSPTNEMWRPSTEHLHQVGNDRVVGVASNYGHVQLRQDEGSPKFLNDHDPQHGVYAGGFGYLTDEATILSTYYPGNAESFERVFGVGYYRKTVEGTGLKADQVIFAPFGDDPLLISQVTLSNLRPNPADLRWIEYWGCKMYQFSYKAFILGISSKKISVPTFRRRLNANFDQTFAPIADTGILAKNHFKGLKFGEKLQWAVVNFFMTTFLKKISGGGVKPPVKEAVLEDIAPPAVFLVSLDAPVDGMSTNPQQFFGEGGLAAPTGIETPLAPEIDPTATLGGLFLERKVLLEPGESQTLYFAYGYLPDGFALDSLIHKYSANLPMLLAESSEKWKGARISLAINDEPWVDREMLWHNYYLRSNMTYDSFFKEHILSQGHVYQYLVGFQGAARDPLQHLLPFIYTNPGIVKEIIRYTLKEIKPSGAIPYGICGSGIVQPSPFAPSDLELWLLWAASEYVLATRDAAFLEEEIPTYPVYGSRAKKVTVRDLLARSYTHFVQGTGTGKHGLQRLSNGDWNDGVVHGNIPPKKVGAVMKEGESVMNAAMASYVLDLYARLLSVAGDLKLAEDARSKATAQRDAVRAQWAGKWFRRAWLSNELQWLGEEDLWLEPQPWAIIGGAATAEQADVLVEVINQELRQPSPIGATLLNNAIKKASEAPGMGTAGGIWPSINGTLIWALARVDGVQSWDEWKKNSLAVHAESYPDVWYGIWSGPDTYNSHFSPHAGQTVFTPPELDVKSAFAFGIRIFWTDFPVMNMHPHAWPLYSTVKLLGLEFTEDGLRFSPALPLEEYTFSSPLVGFQKSREGYEGWYAPMVAGAWKISVQLSATEIGTFNAVIINGSEGELVQEGNCLVFHGESTPEQPLRWQLTA